MISIHVIAQLSSDGLPYMPSDRTVSMVAAPEYVKGYVVNKIN